MLHPRQVLVAVLGHQLCVGQRGVLQREVDGRADVFVAVVEVDEDGAHHVVEGRFGELDVATGEEELNCCGYLQSDWVLRIVQSFQEKWVDLFELIVADGVSE